MKRVSITIDVEQDCPPYLDTYEGIERGMPRLLELFKGEAVPATFFMTGDVARRYPEMVRSVAEHGHEIGCHGDTHPRFSALKPESARREIGEATEVLRGFYPVTSFRAPYLDFPPAYLAILRELGYRLDSSQGRHKSLRARVQKDSLVRIPASLPPSWLRVHRLFSRLMLSFMADPIVLFFHPWEFIDMTRSPIPKDCRFRTGDLALDSLREAIRYFKGKKAKFFRMAELPEALTLP